MRAAALNLPAGWGSSPMYRAEFVTGRARFPRRSTEGSCTTSNRPVSAGRRDHTSATREFNDAVLQRV